MFARLLKRFVTDQEGVFAVIFGVMAIVLVALGGAAVDYVQVDQVKSRAQIALDAAALALQPEIFQTGKTTAQIKAELETTAQDLLDERISDSQVDVDVDLVDYDTDAGRLYIRAQLSVPTAFVALLGINELDFPISTQVTRKKLNIEVAYVLDNSGSMGSYSRMTNLKTAANCATNILFYGSCTPAVGATKNANTKIAVVPFNFFVNVGSSNSSASWIDSTGVSSIANDNFDDDDDDSTAYSGTVDRLDLFSQIGVSWAGCVEARPYPYSVNDTTPNLATPDTLFVPEFAPDEPGNRGSASSGFYNSYIEDSPSSCNVVVGTCNCSNTTETYWCGYPHYWCTRTVKTCSYVASNGSTQSCSCGSGIYTCDAIYTPTGLSNRQKQERLCKYDGANPASMNFDYGLERGLPGDLDPAADRQRHHADLARQCHGIQWRHQYSSGRDLGLPRAVADRAVHRGQGIRHGHVQGHDRHDRRREHLLFGQQHERISGLGAIRLSVERPSRHLWHGHVLHHADQDR